MKPIVTLTVNPAIDAACVADEVVPMRKVRTRDERYDAGGGGINVARVIGSWAAKPWRSISPAASPARRSRV